MFDDGVAPERVAGSALWVSIATGFDHTCGVDNTSRVHCWGANTLGQLGFGFFGYSATPQSVFGGLTFAAKPRWP